MAIDSSVPTLPLPGVDGPPEPPKKRGRPRTGEAKTPSQRQKEYVARLKEQGRVVVSMELPVEVVQAVDAYTEFRDMTRGEAVEKALRDRFMRKR